MELEDRTLSCRDCGSEFTFTAGEQGFYIERGLMNTPQRCPACRTHRRNRGAPDTTTVVTCARCGNDARVPFVPSQDRPVYCNPCYAGLKTATAATH